jgi:hypothetical protein
MNRHERRKRTAAERHSRAVGPSAAQATATAAPTESVAAERKEEELCFGLWQVQEGRHLTREIRDLGTFRSVIGDDLLVGVVQLMTAVNRLDSFHVLLGLNDRPTPSPYPDSPEQAHAPDSIGATRNRVTLIIMRWGVFHQLICATTALEKSGLGALLSASGDNDAIVSWKKLRTVAHQWRQSLEDDVRNQLAAHLGDREAIVDGLNKWPADKPLTLSISDSASRAGTLFSAGLDLLTCGLGISLDNWGKLFDQDRGAADITTDVLRVFFGILYAKRAPIPSATELGRHETK